MARQLQKLSFKAVEKKSKPGCYADGRGLYLQVAASGSKSWLFRYMLNRQAREMGLGSVMAVSLARAREKAADCRQLLAERIDPIQTRDSERTRQALETAKSISFAECAELFIKAHKADWKNPKHVEQWQNTIATYCKPVFGTTPVQNVDTALILKALEPIWATSPKRRAACAAGLSGYSTGPKRGHRGGENPSRWRGHLDKLLPKLDNKKRVKHHPALPFRDIGSFMLKLRAEEGTAARALELLILTTTRTIETIDTRWTELDLDGAAWVIPPERMKAHKEHRIPLSPPAVKLLRALHDNRSDGEEFVFTGLPGRHLSNMALLALLRRMGRDDVTVHGFRSTFRDWASETTNYPHEVCEMALAHTVTSAVEAAYRRGDLFEKRRRLMAEWARYCDTVKATGEVVALNPRRVRKVAVV